MINRSEYNFLLKISNGQWWRDSDIDSNLDFVRRTGYFLSRKGLVEMQEHISQKVELDRRGLEAKQIILRLEDGTDIQNIPSYIIGILKESGMLEGRKFRKVDTNLDQVLLRRFGKVIDEKYYSYRITDLGKKMIDSWKESEYIINIDSLKSQNIQIPYIDVNTIETVNISRTHIITRWKRKIAKIFYELGFKEMSGDYIQMSLWNFDALFQPQDHPSRELADTFYLSRKRKIDIDTSIIEKEHKEYWKYEWDISEAEKLVLRTHTTTLSAITLYKNKHGKYFSIGKVFRNEAIDYKHLAEFHQIEGIIADTSMNFSYLLGFLEEFYSRLGLERIRFRPSYFPYTEPSLEIEAYFPQKDAWIEVGGAGIFREQVSRILECVYPVGAFGLSLERTIMLFEGIEDIRLLYD